MEDKRLTLDVLIDFITKNDGMKGQEIAKALGFAKSEVNSMLYSDFSKGVFECDNNWKWHCILPNRAKTIETKIADNLTGDMDLTFTKKISREDYERYPEIYNISAMSDDDEEKLKAFCNTLGRENDFECLKSYSPGSMNAYYLFLRNKYRCMQNPNFAPTAALLLVYALYCGFFSEEEIISIYSISETHLLERSRGKGFDTKFVKKISKLIIEKADSFAEQLGLPIIPLPLPVVSFSREGIHSVPWKYITFVQGAALVKLPYVVKSKKGNQIPDYRIPVESANDSWNMLKNYFARIPMFQVELRKGKIVRVVSAAPIVKYIDVIQSRNRSVKIEVVPLLIPTSSDFSGYSTSEFRKQVAIDKQPYFDELCKRQLSGYKIVPFKERVVNSTSDTIEEGYAFVIRRDEAGNIFVAFENSNPTSRATLYFKMRESSYKNTMGMICQYLLSSKVNKRQELMTSSLLQASNGQYVSYRRVPHTDFFTWKSKL